MEEIAGLDRFCPCVQSILSFICSVFILIHNTIQTSRPPSRRDDDDDHDDDGDMRMTMLSAADAAAQQQQSSSRSCGRVLGSRGISLQLYEVKSIHMPYHHRNEGQSSIG